MPVGSWALANTYPKVIYGADDLGKTLMVLHGHDTVLIWFTGDWDGAERSLGHTEALGADSSIR